MTKFRLLLWIVALGGLFSQSVSLALTGESSEVLAPAQTAQVEILVDPDWDWARPEDVQVVLNSVVEVISPYVAWREIGTVRVMNKDQGPIALYERGENGEYVILLDVRGRYWSQMVYQFAHEICHVLSNYDLAPNNISNQQWFEESLCEAFSLFALKRMALEWANNPPGDGGDHWRLYAPMFNVYVQQMLREVHRGHSNNLAQWYQEKKDTLESNPYAEDRELNEKMAGHILKVFEKDPYSWGAINFLNLGEDSDDKSLKKYFSDWLSYAPVGMRDVVHSLAKEIGVSPLVASSQ